MYGTGSPARILRFAGEKVAVLATLADPVTAFTHLGETVIYATADGIFALRPGQPFGLLFPLVGHAPLISLTANVDTGDLFGATDDAIYQSDEGRMTQIAQGLGGALALVTRIFSSPMCAGRVSFGCASASDRSREHPSSVVFRACGGREP